MKLVVITPEAIDSREPAVLATLFAAGLERCHVRKPALARDELAAWLRAIPAEFRSRLVLHQHYDLVAEFSLGGRHWRDDGQEVGRVILNPPPQRLLSQEKRRVTDNAPHQPFTSRSCHDLATLRAALGHYDAVFFGPLFPSISKPGYAPRSDVSVDEISTLLALRPTGERPTDVIALGGITAGNISQCRALGFDGVAVLGALWNVADPVRAFSQLQFSLSRHAA